MLKTSCKLTNTFKIKKVNSIFSFFNVQLYVSLINMKEKEYNLLYNSNDILV